MTSVKRMLTQQGFTLEWTPEAISRLADIGYDPEFGARPVKRAIQNEVLNRLSKALLAEQVTREKPIIIDANDQGLVFRN
jgi:ATP-dependent Clp protease ATP-binding subunit ClpB